MNCKALPCVKAKFLFLICLILFFVSVSGVSASEDLNQTIDNDDALSVSEDVNVISAKDDGTFTALQEKIDNAQTGSTITLMNDYLRDSDKDPNKITIDKVNE